ncbi:MAG: STAS domain-containing protein, partial [Caldilineaceae bacterium]
TDIDVTAADALEKLDLDLQGAGIDLRFAEMKDPTKDMLKRFGLYDKVGADAFYPTVGRAVDAYLEQHDVEWLDWEAAPPGKQHLP